jgi:hypothetical protein
LQQIRGEGSLSSSNQNLKISFIPLLQWVHHRGNKGERRVIDETPILTVLRITDTPPIMQAWNPTAKRVLKITSQIHRQLTRNNTLGGVPLIRRVHPIPEGDTPDQPPMLITAFPG